MSDHVENEDGQARLAPWRDQQLVKWADDVQAREFDFLRDLTRQMLTLSAALFGGAAALFVQPHLVIAGWSKGLVIACLILALLAALWGVSPHRRTLIPEDPDAIERVRDSVNLSRTRAFWASMYSILAAFAFAILGLALA